MSGPTDELLLPSSEPMPATEVAGPSVTPEVPKVGGKRTQLKVMRERVQSLTEEVGDFRKSHEVSTKKFEADLASLRRDMERIRTKDLGGHVKGHGAETKRLEKQVATLRKELASVRAQMAKEASKSKAREKALISKITTRVRTAKPKSRVKTSKRRR